MHRIVIDKRASVDFMRVPRRRLSTAVRNSLKSNSSKLRRGPVDPLVANGAPKLGHRDRRLNATRSDDFKPTTLGEIHIAGGRCLRQSVVS
jgi:hypothetical protein